MNSTDPVKTFFISDTHFGHGSAIRLCGRPFADKDEMDAELIERWNAVVPRDGTVYHMGDFSFRGRAATLAILAQLSGKIVLVRGNHDRGMNAEIKSYFIDIREYAELKIGSHFIVMSHYPMESWNKMHHGSWHLHGHSHGNIPDFGKRMDVGVDAPKIKYTPISFHALKAHMDAQPVESRDHHQPKSNAFHTDNDLATSVASR